MTISESILDYITAKGYLTLAGITFYDRLLIVLIIGLICVAIYFILERAIKPILLRMTQQTSSKWDDHLFNSKTIRGANFLIATILCYLLIPIATVGNPSATIIMKKCGDLMILASCIYLINSFISSFYQITHETDSQKVKTLNGLFQVLKVIIACIGIILGVSILFDKSIASILTALGASAAILSLVFKDTILSFVAGAQMNIYDTLRPGDWIIMENRNVNGEVLNINLNNVRILNWDNSIATIPAHLFLSEAFQNYRQMRDDKSRRISKKIFIDINTIKATDKENDVRYKKLTSYSEKANASKSDRSNLFYYRLYLQNHYKEVCVSKSANTTTHHHLMIKTLEPTQYGLPIELYFFTANTDWVDYENFNSVIMEFAFTSLGLFGLKAFQAPSGTDLTNIYGNK